jgi:hypothetical protein
MVVSLGNPQYYYHFLSRSNLFDLTMTAEIYLTMVVEIVIAILMATAMMIAMVIAMVIAMAIEMDLSPYACAFGL